MGDERLDTSNWFLLMVGSRQEKKVARALRMKGFEVFLPLYRARRQWSDRIKEVELPLFSCHLFARFRLRDELAVLKTPGVLSIYGAGNPPAPIPETEVDRLRRAIASRLPTEPWPRLEPGEIAAIREHPDVKGTVIHVGETCRLVLDFQFLGRTIALRVPRESIVPIKAEPPSPASQAPEPKPKPPGCPQND